MDNDMNTRLAALEQKIDAIYVSVEKTRKYFQITLWVTLAMVVLPIILAIFAIPLAMTSYMGSIDESQLELLR